jgi:hypothetical protein
MMKETSIPSESVKKGNNAPQKLSASIITGLVILCIQWMTLIVGSIFNRSAVNIGYIMTFVVASIIYLYTIYAVLRRKNHGRWMLFALLLITALMVGGNQAVRTLNSGMSGPQLYGSVAGSAVSVLLLFLLIFFIGFGQKSKLAFKS